MTILGSESSSTQHPTHPLSGTDILIVIVCDSQFHQLLLSPLVEILFWSGGDDFGRKGEIGLGAIGFKTVGGRDLAGAFVIYLPFVGCCGCCWMGDLAAGGRYFWAGGRYFSGGVILGPCVGGGVWGVGFAGYAGGAGFAGGAGLFGIKGPGGVGVTAGVKGGEIGGFGATGEGFGSGTRGGVRAGGGIAIVEVLMNGVIGFFSAAISESNPRHPSGKKYLKFSVLSGSSLRLRTNDASLK